jgi:hypothetical protein
MLKRYSVPEAEAPESPALADPVRDVETLGDSGADAISETLLILND